MEAFEFSKHVIDVCSRHDFIQGIEIQILDEPVVKIKAVVSDDVFINIFYNAETVKYSFALIKNGRRIFGADNARRWHIHPFDNPDNHKEINDISLAEFLDILNTDKERWL